MEHIGHNYKYVEVWLAKTSLFVGCETKDVSIMA
jgi:hypothetical protein